MNFAQNTGWGTQVQENNQLHSFSHHQEIKKWNFISGVLMGEIAIVEDNHFIPEWNTIADHYNVRVKCYRLANGDRIPKQNFPLPTELTKKHYRLNEFRLIIIELFQKSDFNFLVDSH